MKSNIHFPLNPPNNSTNKIMNEENKECCPKFDPSPWKGEHYIHVTKEVPNAENVKISGTFISKVFDGPYNKVPTWLKAMNKFLSERGEKAKKYYFYYTTCPKCAKKYGHNYVVALAEI